MQIKFIGNTDGNNNLKHVTTFNELKDKEIKRGHFFITNESLYLTISQDSVTIARDIEFTDENLSSDFIISQLNYSNHSFDDFIIPNSNYEVVENNSTKNCLSLKISQSIPLYDLSFLLPLIQSISFNMYKYINDVLNQEYGDIELINNPYTIRDLYDLQIQFIKFNSNNLNYDGSENITFIPYELRHLKISDLSPYGKFSLRDPLCESHRGVNCYTINIVNDQVILEICPSLINTHSKYYSKVCQESDQIYPDYLYANFISLNLTPDHRFNDVRRHLHKYLRISTN